MLFQLRTVLPQTCLQLAGTPGRCCGHNRLPNRCNACAGPVCLLFLTYSCQDRKKAGSRRPLLARKTLLVAACAPYAFTHTSDAVPQSDEDVPLSTEDKRDSSHSNEADPVGSMPPIAKSIFDVMIDMAKDPDVLELFNPYLPRNARTHAGLAKAMTIADWRRQVLVGESQVRESEIITNVWRQAQDKDKLNEELRQLGFLGLMQQ